MNKDNFVVLMAEDNEHDVIATRRAWKKNNIENPLKIVNNGEECLDYLYRKGKYADSEKYPLPGLILMDINMPRVDGLTALKEIREDDRFKKIPVVMLTTSQADEDRLRSYDNGANAYMVKPTGFKKFTDTIKAISIFWRMVDVPE